VAIPGDHLPELLQSWYFCDQPEKTLLGRCIRWKLDLFD
jgi:hypothetical protein